MIPIKQCPLVLNGTRIFPDTKGFRFIGLRPLEGKPEEYFLAVSKQRICSMRHDFIGGEVILRGNIRPIFVEDKCAK